MSVSLTKTVLVNPDFLVSQKRLLCITCFFFCYVSGEVSNNSVYMPVKISFSNSVQSLVQMDRRTAAFFEK